MCRERSTSLNVAMANATKVHLKANVQGSNRVHHGRQRAGASERRSRRTSSFQNPVTLTVNLPSGIAPQNVGGLVSRKDKPAQLSILRFRLMHRRVINRSGSPARP